MTNETELEAFLGRLVDDVARGSGGRISADSARASDGGPQADGRADVADADDRVRRRHRARAMAGRSPVSTAARVYGLELEGLSAEDRDFEIARQFIRFAEAAARRGGEPTVSAPDRRCCQRGGRGRRAGVRTRAAASPARDPDRPAASGPWVRRGNTIVLIGLQPVPI